MHRLTCSESQHWGSRWKRTSHSSQPAKATLACPSHTWLQLQPLQGGSPWRPPGKILARVQLQPFCQSHWAGTVCVRLHLHKAMPSRLGEATVLPNLQKWTESQTKGDDKGICAKERTRKPQKKKKLNKMEKSNYPKRVKSNGHEDAHWTWETSGGTQWECQQGENMKKNQPEPTRTITEMENTQEGLSRFVGLRFTLLNGLGLWGINQVTGQWVNWETEQ